MGKKHTWVVVATGALVLSVVTLFLPIMIYRNGEGAVRSFNVVGMMLDPTFATFVFRDYRGSFLYGLPYATIRNLAILLSVVGIAAIIMALVGIHSMTKQYESERPFRLALCGLLGTALPALTLLTLLLLSRSSFIGSMHVGPYLIVTPIAMAIACYAVTARHRVSVEEARLLAEAQRYIRPAGDLPPAYRYGR